MLRIPHLLHKGTNPTVDHEDEGGWPGEHLSGVVLVAGGVSLAAVDGGVAEVGVGVDEGLVDGSAVGGGAEEGFAVGVAVFFA